MESEWVPAMQQLLGLDDLALPVLWDADFLFGPKTASGEDSYALCEINVSNVTPFPEFAADRIAQAAATCLRKAREAGISRLQGQVTGAKDG